MNNNIIGWSYEQMATGRLAMLRSMMDAVINAELLAMVPVIKALLVIWLGRQFLLLMYGLVSTETFITSVIRPAVVVFLIGHTGQFVHYVRDPLFDTIPRAVSSTILSAAGIQTRSTEAISTQFDAMAAGVDMLSSRALALNTSWSASAIANGIGIYMATTGAQILLACVFGIFLLGQTLLAVVLCLGPLVLVFELFERTRPWTSAWLGKMVGLVAFGIGTSLLLAIQMQELHDLIASISANSGNNAADRGGFDGQGCQRHRAGLFDDGVPSRSCRLWLRGGRGARRAVLDGIAWRHGGCWPHRPPRRRQCSRRTSGFQRAHPSIKEREPLPSRLALLALLPILAGCASDHKLAACKGPLVAMNAKHWHPSDAEMTALAAACPEDK